MNNIYYSSTWTGIITPEETTHKTGFCVACGDSLDKLAELWGVTPRRWFETDRLFRNRIIKKTKE